MMRLVMMVGLIATGTPAFALADGATGHVGHGKWPSDGQSHSLSTKSVWTHRGAPAPRQLGRPKLEKKNPNPMLRNRRLVGLTLFRGMKATGSNQWEGRIYVPDDGNTYYAVITINGSVMKGSHAQISSRRNRDTPAHVAAQRQ